MMVVTIYVALFLSFLAAAAIGDMRTLRIPNALTGSMAALGPLAVALAIPQEGALAGSLIAGGATLAAAWAMFELGWLGGGDAKLATAVALWLGGPATATFALATALFGAALALVLVVLRRRRTASGGERIAIPYAVAMAPAGLVALPVRLDFVF